MPHLKWNGTGIKYIEIPVGPRGLVELKPGMNKVTDQELAAMESHIKLDMDNGMIELLEQPPASPETIVPGMVEAIEEEPEAPSAAAPTSAPALDPQSKPSSILEELLAKTDAELAEIAKEYGVKKRFLEKRESLAKAIMAKAGYKVEDDSATAEPPALGPEPPAELAPAEPASDPAEPPAVIAAPAEAVVATEAPVETAPDAAPAPLVEAPAAPAPDGEPAPETPAT